MLLISPALVAQEDIQYLAILSLVSISGIGQEYHQLMDWKTQYTVRTHLLQEVNDQYDLRRADIQEALMSEESMLTYRDACRQRNLGLQDRKYSV